MVEVEEAIEVGTEDVALEAVVSSEEPQAATTTALASVATASLELRT
ncbi:MAG: hypothetical protein ACLGHX_02185 [Acidimicrobiia bacterium]